LITLVDQITEDSLCLKHYFEKKFVLLAEAKSVEAEMPMVVRDNAAPYNPRVQISHLIKPDMLINIYSLFDYWAKRVCNHKKQTCGLELGWKDIKGNNDLHIYHKYLSKYAGMNLTHLDSEYQGIDNLRKIRNYFIHQGGHVLDEGELKNIQWVSLNLGVIVIQDEFVWHCLEHARKYLVGIAEG